MKKIVWVNPLKPGKLEAYKAFSATNTGSRKKEYVDLLSRYGLLNVQVYYHKLNDQEFVIVMHDTEDDAMARLAHFNDSKNAYDRWFTEQLNDLHDFTNVTGAGHSELLFTFDPHNKQ